MGQLARSVTSRRRNKSVALGGITDMEGPVDGVVSVETDPSRHFARSIDRHRTLARASAFRRFTNHRYAYALLPNAAL